MQDAHASDTQHDYLRQLTLDMQNDPFDVSPMPVPQQQQACQPAAAGAVAPGPEEHEIGTPDAPSPAPRAESMAQSLLGRMVGSQPTRMVAEPGG